MGTHMHNRQPHRMNMLLKFVLCVSALALFALAACSDQADPPAMDPAESPTQQPTATPQPTPTTVPATPQPTPTTVPATPQPTTVPPTPVSADSAGVEFWDLSRSSTGRDLIALLTPEETSCLKDTLGGTYAAMLTMPLAGEAGALLEGDGSGPSPMIDCLSEVHLASARLSMLSLSAGGFSAGTQACMEGLISQDPAISEALARPDGSIDGPAMLGLLACMTPGEAAALTPPDEGPAPNPNDIGCLMTELEGTASGERILAVLSGADESGTGLTIEESAALGRAVEACGIETDFSFPDGADHGAADDDSSTWQEATADDVAALVEGNTEFAFDLYRALVAGGYGDRNLFYSPYSVSMALALAYGGAKGETRDQMAETLHFSLPAGRLHPAFSTLNLSLDPDAFWGGDAGFRLNVANALWGQEGHGFLGEYLDLLAMHYGGVVQDADFRGDPEGARHDINDWAATETRDRIRDLIPRNAIDASTRLVLANAVHYSATWNPQFGEEDTAPGSFFLPDGTEREVPMMRMEHHLGYVSGYGFQAVQMDYLGSETDMLIFLPDRGGLAELEEVLGAAVIQATVDSINERRVRLILPRFETESAFSLADALTEMGMPSAFDPERADFAGMDGRSCLARDPECLSISDVLHRSFVSVDEAGTEAAAASAVVVVGSPLAPEEFLEVAFDRPFIFVVRHVQSGTILFVGRILDP